MEEDAEAGRPFIAALVRQVHGRSEWSGGSIFPRNRAESGPDVLGVGLPEQRRNCPQTYYPDPKHPTCATWSSDYVRNFSPAESAWSCCTCLEVAVWAKREQRFGSQWRKRPPPPVQVQREGPPVPCGGHGHGNQLRRLMTHGGGHCVGAMIHPCGNDAVWTTQ
jgi:hypothetical protein